MCGSNGKKIFKEEESFEILKILGLTNSTEHLLLTLTCAVTGCVPISTFASLSGIPIGTTGSAVGLKICEINTGIKKNK